MRCSPSSLMSPTVNSPGSVAGDCAWERPEVKARATARASRDRMLVRFLKRRGGRGDRSAEAPGEIVVAGKADQQDQQHDSELLAEHLHALRQWPAGDALGQLIDDLPAVQ